jgi:hypothetical protein
MKGFGGVDCELHEMKGFVTTGMGMLHALHTFTKCKKKRQLRFNLGPYLIRGKNRVEVSWIWNTEHQTAITLFH